MHDFEWNGGGSWNGHPWKAGELPTDTTLLFYLFAAFVEVKHICTSPAVGIIEILCPIPTSISSGKPRLDAMQTNGEQRRKALHAVPYSALNGHLSCQMPK